MNLDRAYRSIGYDDPLCHSATIDIPVEANNVFSFLTDPDNLIEWENDVLLPAARKLRKDQPGYLSGVQIENDTPITLAYRSVPDALVLNIGYGDSKDKICWNTSIRVLDGERLGIGRGVSRVSILYWRTDGDDDYTWFKVRHSFFNRVTVLRRLLEKSFPTENVLPPQHFADKYDDPLCHTGTVDIDVPAQFAYDYLAIAANRNEWAGSLRGRTMLPSGVYVATWSGGTRKHYTRYQPVPSGLLVDSAAGEAEDEIYWNVSVRVIPAETLLEDPSHCRVTLMTWRTSADPDEFWFDMYHAYLCYMERLKIILERRFKRDE